MGFLTDSLQLVLDCFYFLNLLVYPVGVRNDSIPNQSGFSCARWAEKLNFVVLENVLPLFKGEDLPATLTTEEDPRFKVPLLFLSASVTHPPAAMPLIINGLVHPSAILAGFAPQSMPTGTLTCRHY